jgi:nucleotide-binding universal stress UspA family protein
MSHIRKILVPMDGSQPSLAALEQAADLADDLGASVDVLYVDAAPATDATAAPQVTGTVRAELERALQTAFDAAFARLGSRLMRETVTGEPIRAILDGAARRSSDLIVIGTYGRIGRLASLAGSLAEAVVRTAPCPVLTVRYSDGEQESFSERVHGRSTITGQSRSD